MAKQLQNVKHDYIRYANCWEDADILLEGLDVKKGDRVLSIGSAGDNSFSLLLGDPEIVVAVDINVVQLNLIALKKAAFLALDHAEFLSFLGFRLSNKRQDLFEKVKKHLSDEHKIFWENRFIDVETGVINKGKFENYFNLFRTKILPFVHRRSKVANLFKEKSEAQQKHFFEHKWNTWRWRSLFRLFFSKFVMGKFGRDPKFLKEVDVKVSDFILTKAANHLKKSDAQKNYFLQFIMNGRFENQLPHYARAENFDKIKGNLDKLIVFHGLAEDAFKAYSGFNKFNLSNIFEYMDQQTFDVVTDSFLNNSSPNSRFCYWNLMVPRFMSSGSQSLKCLERQSQDLSEKDKGFFYARFIIEEKI